MQVNEPEQMRIGIASILYARYPDIFSRVAFNPDKCHEIDEYYKDYAGVADGNEETYACENDDGLYLLIKLAFEKVW